MLFLLSAQVDNNMVILLRCVNFLCLPETLAGENYPEFRSIVISEFLCRKGQETLFSQRKIFSRNVFFCESFTSEFSRYTVI